MDGEQKADKKTDISIWALIVLVAIGPPSAVYNFSDWAIENPWPALGLASLWGVALIVGTFFTNVGRNLVGLWAKGIAGWIDAAVQRGLSGYRKYYLQHAIYFRHRNFDVKGLTTQGTYTTR